MKRIFVILGLTACLAWIRAEDLRVVSYNVENLFHPKHDTVCIDSTTFIEKDDYENKVAGHFLGKLREVEFSFHITVPSGLFTTYNSRKKDAEKKAINYIDSKLGNFIAWVIQHEEILH